MGIRIWAELVCHECGLAKGFSLLWFQPTSRYRLQKRDITPLGWKLEYSDEISDDAMLAKGQVRHRMQRMAYTTSYASTAEPDPETVREVTTCSSECRTVRNAKMRLSDEAKEDYGL